MEKFLKNLRNTIPYAVVVAMAALGCVDTALAQPNTFVVDNSNLTFCGPNATGQSVNLSTSGAPAAFTVTLNTGSQSNWLQVSQAQGTVSNSPSLLIVSVNSGVANSFSPGTYSGTVTISGGAQSVTINASLVIGQSNCSSGGGGNGLSITPVSVIFNVPANNSGTQIQTVTVQNTTQFTVNLSASSSTTTGSGWLSVGTFSSTTLGPSQATQFQISAFPGAVAFGASYSGSVTVTNGAGGSFVIPVTLNYGTSGGGGGGGGSSVLTASPSSLTATLPFPSSGPSTSGLVVANTSPSAIAVTPSVSISSGQNWLSVVPTGATTIQANSSVLFSVTITPGALSQGTYTGSVIFTPSNGSGALTVPVTLNYGNGSGGGGAGGLTYSPNPFVISLASGTSTNQTLSVTNNTASTANLLLNITLFSGQNWLTFQQSGTTQTNNLVGPSSTAFFNITVNPSGLTPGNTYTAQITVADQNNVAGNLTIPVTLCYAVSGTCQGSSGGASVLSASPAPINVSIPSGSTTPVNQTLTVTSSSSTPFSALAATSTGFGWLTVNPSSATSTPATLIVSVNPAFLPSGTTFGSGSITLTPTNGGTALVVPVNVTVGGTPTLTISPSQLSFAYQTGTPFPVAQTLLLSSATGASFSASASTGTGGNWLIVSPQAGFASSAPTALSVSINPSGLAAGTYNGQVTITNSSTGTQQTVAVSLLVSNLPVLSLSNSGTTFNYQFQSATLPTQQSVQVTSSGNPLQFSTSVSSSNGVNFLTVTPSSGNTPQTLALSINPGVLPQLAPGAYTATVTLSSSGAGNNSVSYPVTLNVTNTVLLNPSQSSLNFNYQLGQAQPATQTINIGSTGAPLSYTASATSANCGGNFLSVSPASGATTGTIAVSVNTAGLAAGTCTGAISIASAGAGNTPLNIPVTLYVSSAPLLNVSPGFINVTTQVGTNVTGNSTIALTSTDPTVQLSYTSTFTLNNGTNWFAVTPASGATASNLTILYNTAALAVGTYTGSVTITATGASNAAVANSPVTVPVTVVITSSATASTSPTSLTFLQPFGGQAPASQTLMVNSTSPGLTFSASASTLSPAGGNWLSVANANGTTPGSVTVSVNGGGLSQGSYSGVVTITFGSGAVANSVINVPVTLTIGPGQTVAVSPAALTFNYTAGAGTTPAAQTVQLTSVGGNVPFTATTSTPSGTANFLTVTPASGTTPASLSIGLNQSAIANLAAGSYTGAVIVASPGLASVTINVSLAVAAAPPPSVTSVANAASNQPGPVSAGEVVAIFGSNIGPTPSIGLTLTSGGAVSTNIGNTTVSFDGNMAPLIFVSAGQINAIVPYEVAGRVTTNVTVSRNGLVSSVLQLRVADTAPAIFSLTQTGNGQGAILNQNGSVNGAGNPAAKGSVIVIYATGEGALVPGVATGSVTPGTGTTFPKPVGNVSLTIGGLPATILYAGEAPGLISGVLQVNALVPNPSTGPGLPSGNNPIVLTVGSGTNNQQQIAVAVQ